MHFLRSGNKNTEYAVDWNLILPKGLNSPVEVKDKGGSFCKR